MSQSDAKTPELAKVVGIFASLVGIKKGDQTTEMDVKEGSEVKESEAGEMRIPSKLEEEVAEIGDKDNDEPKSNIPSVINPEVNLNEDVIAIIAKFLDYQDLKSVRQVDTLWSAGVTPAFVQNSVVVLSSVERRQELEAFERDTKDLKGLTTLSIRLYQHFGFEEKSDLFNDILGHLSPKLKNLELKVMSKNSFFLPRASIQLPALTSFTFDADHADAESRRRLFQFLYASAPNLTELDILKLDSAILSPLMTDDGTNCRNLALAPKLKSLKMRDYLSPGELAALVEFPQNWEILDIKVSTFGARKNESLRLLSQLLETNKDSLVRLALVLNTQATRARRQTFKFPATFSKLKEFYLHLLDCDRIVDFGGAEVNYCKMFPSLTSLSILSGFDPNLEMLARICIFFFLPQEFRGLKTLKLKTLGDYAQFLSIQEVPEDWAQVIFPNARIDIGVYIGRN